MTNFLLNIIKNTPKNFKFKDTKEKNSYLNTMICQRKIIKYSDPYIYIPDLDKISISSHQYDHITPSFLYEL